MTRVLNCRELLCPMPIVHLATAVEELASGDVLVVEATDPAFELDVQAWAEMTGHELIRFESSDVHRAHIRVA